MMTRIKLLLAGAFLVAMTMTSTPVRAWCAAPEILTGSEEECAAHCYAGGCGCYIYDAGGGCYCS